MYINLMQVIMHVVTMAGRQLCSILQLCLNYALCSTNEEKYDQTFDFSPTQWAPITAGHCQFATHSS